MIFRGNILSEGLHEQSNNEVIELPKYLYLLLLKEVAVRLLEIDSLQQLPQVIRHHQQLFLVIQQVLLYLLLCHLIGHTHYN